MEYTSLGFNLIKELGVVFLKKYLGTSTEPIINAMKAIDRVICKSGDMEFIESSKNIAKTKITMIGWNI